MALMVSIHVLDALGALVMAGFFRRTEIFEAQAMGLSILSWALPASYVRINMLQMVSLSRRLILQDVEGRDGT